MNTRLTALAAAVSSLSMLTACGGGAGDGGSGDTPTYTPPAVTYYSSSSGIWTGTAGSRAVAGVVTADPGKNYWLVYSENSGPAPAGFYFGNASDDAGSGSVGGSQGALTSAEVIRFDFEGDAVVRKGTLAATYPRTSITTKEANASPYTTANSLSGAFRALTGTTYDVEMNASNNFPAANGSLNFIGFTGVWDSDTDQGSWGGRVTVPSFNAIMDYTQNFVMHDQAVGTANNEKAGGGRLFPLDFATCTDNSLARGELIDKSSCAGFQGPLSSNFLRNTAVNPSNPDDYKIPVGFTPVDGWTGQWVFHSLSNGVTNYVPMNVTLHSRPTTNSISNTVLALTYNPLFEDGKPLMARIAGNYTSGWTGIVSTRYADASLTILDDNPATLERPFDGLISGTESASFCNYSGVIEPHTKKGNLYDVYNLTFTNAAGGTCAYTGEGFIGVAVYDAGKLTLTAMNSAKNKGFMVVAIKP